MQVWQIYQLNGSLIMVPDGDNSPVGAVHIGTTSDPNYLTQMKPREHTKLSFRRLFTLNERIAIDNFHDSATIPEAYKPALKTILKDMDAAETINLDDADTIEGVQFLETVGLISQGRASAILS